MISNALVNLLIIDDKQENLSLISSFFDETNVVIKTTTSPAEAISVCKEIEFDLFLIDIRMPVDGFEVYRLLKESPKNALTPVIFLAEKTDSENISKAFNIGCRDVLTKPFQREELVSKITIHSFAHVQQKKIKALMSAKDNIFSIIGHDLRSPYNSLIGFSQLLVEKLDATENLEVIKYAKIINSLALKNLELLDSLLGYAKNLEKEDVAAFEKVIVTTIISDVVQTTQPAAFLKNIQLNLIIGESVVVFGKKDLIATMIRNFLSNAIKFTPEGGCVSIQAKYNKDWVEIEISDNGIGMNKNKIDAIFKATPTVPTTGTSGELGTGYGLLLSKEIIDKHDGEILFDSEEGVGTTIKIKLPRYK